MLENVKSYRGTWEEIASHKDELPPNAILEIRVVAAAPVANGAATRHEGFNSSLAETPSSQSLADFLGDFIGSVEGSGENNSDDTGRKFAAHLAKKHSEHRL